MSTSVNTDKLDSLLNDRVLLVESLENKQVEASDDETITSLVGKVNTIVSGELETDPYFNTSGTMNTNTTSDKVYCHILSIFNKVPDNILQVMLTNPSVSLYSCGFYGITNIHLKSSYNYIGTSLQSLCMYLPNISSITWDSNLDTSVFTSFKQMFLGCSNLTTIDLSGLDTSGVTDMSSMFSSCASLSSMSFDGWDTSHVTDFSNMFNWCTSLTYLDLSSFTFGDGLTINLYNMYYYSLTYLDISGFDFVNTTSTLNYITSLTNNVRSDCFIYVKDQANLDYFVSKRTSGQLTNIHVKEV